MDNTLTKIYHPRGVAVIGASNVEHKWGHVLLKRILEGGYRGKVYPVNPRGGVILGLEAYKSLMEIEDQVDLAIVGIPRELVMDTMKECIKKNVAGVVVCTAGFSEVGRNGTAIQEELAAICSQDGTRLIGPNCMGMTSGPARLNATIVGNVPAGTVALLAQSGNLGVLMFEQAKEKGIGFSTYTSLGNQVDLTFSQLVRFFGNDQNTDVISLYMEGLKDGREFIEAARKASLNKPVVVLKSGRSASGMKSVESHTGMLAGSDAIYDAAFKRAGVVRVKRLDEFFPVTEAFVKLPYPKSNRVGIITDGGGFSVIAADCVEDYNLVLPEYSPETRERLEQILPGYAPPPGNPLDTAGGMDDNPYLFAECADVMLQDEGIDSLMFVGAFGDYQGLIHADLEKEEIRTAVAVSEMIARYKKPVLIQSIHANSSSSSIKVFKEMAVPVYDSIEIAVRTLSALAEYGNYRSMLEQDSIAIPKPPKVKDVSRLSSRIKKLKEDYTFMPENEGAKFLRHFEVPVVDFQFAGSEEEAARVSRSLGYPVVMKLLSPDISHKSDVGGVKLDLQSESEVIEAFKSIKNNLVRLKPEARFEGVIISPFLGRAVEVIAGAVRDPHFGPVLMFGSGGTLVEVIQDVAFDLCPLPDKEAALQLIRKTKVYRLLCGVRGEAPADLDSLSSALVNLSRVMMSLPEITQIDLNPIMVFKQGEGALAVDVRIII